jgi:hypothetical protein
MDHLTDILHYLQVEVMPSKLPISSVFDMADSGSVNDSHTLKVLQQQIDKFLAY